MKIVILTIGKIKNTNIQALIAQYQKVINKYAVIEIVILKESKIADSQKGIKEDGQTIINWLEKNKLTESVILLDARGRQTDSDGFSRQLGLIKDDHGKVVFIIPGAFGGSSDLKNKIRNHLSLSKMTTTHELAQLFLLEQIYRGLNILAGSEYHK